MVNTKKKPAAKASAQKASTGKKKKDLEESKDASHLGNDLDDGEELEDS